MIGRGSRVADDRSNEWHHEQDVGSSSSPTPASVLPLARVSPLGDDEHVRENRPPHEPPRWVFDALPPSGARRGG